MKKLLAVLLALSTLLSLASMNAVAADNEAEYHSPTVTELTVTYDDGEKMVTVSLLPLSSDQSQITLPEGSVPVFEIKFDNIARLNQVYVTSTRDDDVKYLEALYNQQKGAYVTNGFFDPDDETYVPGTIGVTYTKKTTKVTENTKIDDDIDLAVLKRQLITQGVSLESHSVAADDTVSGRVVLQEMFNAGADVYVETTISTLVQESGVDESELNRWLGVYKELGDMACRELKGEDGKDYTLYLDLTDANTYLMIVRDITENKYTKMLITKAADGVGLGDISTQLSQANFVTGTLLKYTAITDEMDSLREIVDSNHKLSAEEKVEADKKINDLEQDKLLFMMATTALPMFVGIGAAAGPAGLLFSALLAGITATSSYFWENRIGMILGCDEIEDVFYESGDHPGWKIPEMITAQRGVIRENGKYYLPGNLGSVTICENIEATLCLHGHNITCVYIEDGVALRIQDETYMEHDDGTVTGGIIKNPISMPEQTELTLDSGIIRGNHGHAIAMGNFGSVTVNGGMIEGIHGAAIRDDGDGVITINGGILKARGTVLSPNDSTITINGGILTGDDIIQVISNSNVNLNDNIQIYGGSLTGAMRTNGEITISMEEGVISGDIHAGTVTFQNGICTGDVSGDTITITGGEIHGSVRGTDAMIQDGLISGGATFDTDAIAVINGGTVRGGIVNYRDSRLTINGGTIYDGIYNSNIAKLTITNGTINGGIENYSSHKIVLQIHSATTIQVSGAPAFNTAPIVSRTDYLGNVIYYGAAGIQGRVMTVEQAENLLAETYAEQEFVCLAADSVNGAMGYYDPIDWAYPIEWTYTRSSNEMTVDGAVSNLEPVYIASYNKDGKMLSISRITTPGEQISLTDSADLIKLFWLDDGYMPQCETVIIDHP